MFKDFGPTEMSCGLFDLLTDCTRQAKKCKGGCGEANTAALSTKLMPNRCRKQFGIPPTSEKEDDKPH